MNCEECPLKGKIVPGEGRMDDPTLFIVGEAPGREEEEQGRPFVGGAGKVLNQVLYKAGVRREDCYITNVVKCRPPGNRVPTQQEIDCCRTFLKEEFKIIKPPKTLLVGDTASKEVLGLPQNLWRGMCLRSQYTPEGWALATYHTAFVMRQWEWFSTVVWDIQKLLKWEGHKELREEYLINPSLDRVKLFFEEFKKKPIAVDIETRGGDKEESEKGLNPFADEIIGIGFCGAPGYALNLSGRGLQEAWSYVEEFLQANPFIIIHTKGTFDNTFLAVKGIKFRHHWNTATGLYCVYSDTPSRKLEYLRSLYTDIPPYKHIYKNPSQLSEINLGRYNCLDVDVTYRSYQAQLNYTPRALMDRMMKEEYCAMQMRLRGILVDKDKLVEHYALILPRLDELRGEFNEIGVNIGSNKQISDFLYKELGLTPSYKALSNKSYPSVDEEELVYQKRKLKEDDPKALLLGKVLDFREKDKIASTYCEGVYKIIQEDGRVHPDWDPQGTDTGRWACKRPNIQNVPREMRDIYVAPEGKILYGADFNRLELWIGALLAGEDKMLSLLRGGVDIHGIVGDEMHKSDPTIPRIKVKAVVFGGIYGRAPANVAKEFGVTVDKVKTWYGIFYNQFPKFVHFMEENIRLWKSKGFLETPFGRKKYCRTEREALNFPIQSTASDVVVNSIIKLEEAGFNLIMNIHDQIVCEEEDNSRFKEFIEITETSCQFLNDRFPVEGKEGRTWLEV